MVPKSQLREHPALESGFRVSGATKGVYIELFIMCYTKKYD